MLTDYALQKAQEYFEIQGLPVGMTYDDPAWREILLQWRLAAAASMGKTDVTLDEINSLDSKSAKKAFTDAWSYVNDAVPGVLQAMVDGDLVKAALGIPRATAREALISMYVYSSSGATLHWEGAFERAIAAGRITERGALEHLSRCIGIFEVIAKMGGCTNSGMPNYNSFCDPSKDAIAFFRKSPLSGIGVFGVDDFLVVVAGVAAVVIALGLFWIMVESIKQIRAQERALDQCEALLEQGKYEEHKACIQNVLDASNENMNNAFKGMNDVLTYAAVGLGLYAAIIFLPDILKAMRSAKATTS